MNLIISTAKDYILKLIFAAIISFAIWFPISIFKEAKDIIIPLQAAGVDIGIFQHSLLYYQIYMAKFGSFEIIGHLVAVIFIIYPISCFITRIITMR